MSSSSNASLSGPAIPRRHGPLDDQPWPDQLTARVVTPGPAPRLHGYDVEGDLARHYSFVETALLALRGELPTAPEARAFEIALQFLAPAAVNEAPAHAAVIVRICNVLTSAILGTAAIGLGEEARAALEQHEGWLRSLDSGAGSDGAAWLATSDAERASVGRLRDALRRHDVVIPALEGDLGRMPAILATLHFAGLTRAEQMESAMVLARLPATVAEALATPSHSYRDYPVDLPAVRYTEES